MVKIGSKESLQFLRSYPICHLISILQLTLVFFFHFVLRREGTVQILPSSFNQQFPHCTTHKFIPNTISRIFWTASIWLCKYSKFVIGRRKVRSNLSLQPTTPRWHLYLQQLSDYSSSQDENSFRLLLPSDSDLSHASAPEPKSPSGLSNSSRSGRKYPSSGGLQSFPLQTTICSFSNVTRIQGTRSCSNSKV